MNIMKRRVFDRHGNEIELDDNAILPDGCRLRVPLMLRDQHAVDAARLIADQRLVDEARRAASVVQSWADHHRRQREQRERTERADASMAAYRDLCDQLQRGCTGVAA